MWLDRLRGEFGYCVILPKSEGVVLFEAGQWGAPHKSSRGHCLCVGIPLVPTSTTCTPQLGTPAHSAICPVAIWGTCAESIPSKMQLTPNLYSLDANEKEHRPITDVSKKLSEKSVQLRRQQEAQQWGSQSGW